MGSCNLHSCSRNSNQSCCCRSGFLLVVSRHRDSSSFFLCCTSLLSLFACLQNSIAAGVECFFFFLFIVFLDFVIEEEIHSRQNSSYKNDECEEEEQLGVMMVGRQLSRRRRKRSVIKPPLARLRTTTVGRGIDAGEIVKDVFQPRGEGGRFNSVAVEVVGAGAAPLLLLLLCLLLLSSSPSPVHAATTQWVVGGDTNLWGYPPNVTLLGYPPTVQWYTDVWATQQQFQAGDSLVFIFKTGFHSVLQFGNNLDYTNCNLGNAIALYETGDDVVPLPTPGTYYFGCGFERHCSEYFIKLKINVVAAAAPGPLAAAGGGGASPAPSPDQSLGACTGVTAAGGCIPTTLKSGSASSVGVIAGCVVGAACLLLVAGIAAVVVGKRRNHHKQLLSRTKSRRHHIGASLGAAAMGSGGIGFLDGPRMFTYKELSIATKGFSSSFLLGQGGFGSVYKGVLRDNNTLVAVKQIAKDSRQGAAEFLAEVSIISKIRHRNLVRLQGWCQEGEKLFIVYDHMHNGSLDKFLVPEEEEDGRGGGGMAAAAATTVAERPILSWSQRYNILCGVAAALAYLHEEWEQCILHRDIKPSNVLLDSKFNAYLGDFGMARLLEHSKKAHTTFVAGTMGYLAPELPHTRKANTKTDIFSFGVLMLEVTCGRRPFNPNLPEEEVYLLDWVWSLHQSSSLPLCVDPRLVEAYDLMQSKLVLQLGLLCSHPDPDSRPSMQFVRQVLSGDISLPSLPASKPEISYTWKNTGLITGGGVGGVLPIRESTSMVGSEPASSLDSQDQRLMDVSI